MSLGNLYAILLGVVAIIIRYLALNQTSYPNGWDGYYYVMQAHSWLTYGYLQSIDYSLIYPYFISLSYLIGDYVMAFKLGSAILGGALVVVIFKLVFRYSKVQWVAILFSCYFLFSPTLTYLISQFPKNVLGLIFFLLFIISLDAKRWKPVIAYSFLSILTHRMTGGLCMLVLIFIGLKYLNWKWIVIGFVLVSLLSFLPGVFHLSDLERFSGEVLLNPQFAPFSFYSLFENNLTVWWKIEIVLLAISLIFIGVFYFNQKLYNSASVLSSIVWPMLLIISLFPFFKMENGSMGYRFFLVSPIMAFVFLSGLIKVRKMGLLLGSGLFFVLSLFSLKSYNPTKHDPPNKLYEVITERLSERFDAKDYPLVIVHKSLAEMIIFKTGFDALNWSPSENVDKDNTLRIVHDLEYFHFTNYLNEHELDNLTKLTLHYYVMTERNWELFISRIKAAKDITLLNQIQNSSNPMKERPYYLKKGKDL